MPIRALSRRGAQGRFRNRRRLITWWRGCWPPPGRRSEIPVGLRSGRAGRSRRSSGRWRSVDRCRRAGVHGRPGPLHGQHLHRAAMAVAQIRGGLPDYVLGVFGPDEILKSWLVLDAKFRSIATGVRDGLGKIHIYRDSLRWNGIAPTSSPARIRSWMCRQSMQTMAMPPFLRTAMR